MEYISTSDTKVLLDIQASDYQRSLYETEIALMPGKIRREEEKLAAADTAWQSCYDKLKSLQLSQRAEELKVSELETAIERYQEQSHTVKDNDSYKSMLAQIEYAKTKKDEAETKALLILDEIEICQKDEQAAKLKKTEISKEKDEFLAKLAERKKVLESLIAIEQQKKLSLSGQIKDIKVFDKYENLNKKGKKVIFSIKESDVPADGKVICPACNMMLTQHFSGLLRKPDLFVICPECGAWLCLESIVS